MTDPSRDAAFTIFPILTAAIEDFDHPETPTAALGEVRRLLDELEANGGRDAVAVCVHMLALQCLGALHATQLEQRESLYRTVEGLEQSLLRSVYGEGT